MLVCPGFRGNKLGFKVFALGANTIFSCYKQVCSGAIAEFGGYIVLGV